MQDGDSATLAGDLFRRCQRRGETVDAESGRSLPFRDSDSVERASPSYWGEVPMVVQQSVGINTLMCNSATFVQTSQASCKTSCGYPDEAKFQKVSAQRTLCWTPTLVSMVSKVKSAGSGVSILLFGSSPSTIGSCEVASRKLRVAWTQLKALWSMAIVDKLGRRKLVLTPLCGICITSFVYLLKAQNFCLSCARAAACSRFGSMCHLLLGRSILRSIPMDVRGTTRSITTCVKRPSLRKTHFYSCT